MYGYSEYGAGFGYGGSGSGGTPTPAPVPFSAVASDGWQSTVASPTDLSLTPFAVSRQGYDATGTATTISETMYLTKRVRQVYPNEGLFTANQQAVSDYIFSTDTMTGATNNSLEISPKPIAAWTMPDRLLVGNSIPWEIIAFHYNCRDNQQVACVQVRATDGTNTTAWQTVSSTAISTLAEDACPIEVYGGTLDITALNTGLVAMEGRVFPFIGAAASVLASADQSARREFSARYYLKNVARAASPPLAYVSSTGVDATGVWSTTAATAEAMPFLTVGGAMMAINDAVRGTPATGGVADGCRIRIVNTVNAGTTTTTRPQNVATLIVERAPGTSRAAAIVTLGASMRCRLGVGTLTAPLTEGSITFTDLTLNRTGAFNVSGESGTSNDVRFHNVTFPNTSATSIRSNSHNSFYGVNFTTTAPTLGFTAGLENRIFRGVTVDLNNQALELFNNIGSQWTRGGAVTIADASKPMIEYSNRLLNPIFSSPVITINGAVSGGNLGGIVCLQNLFETAHTTGSTAALRIAGDDGLGNIVHAVIGYNTLAGYGAVGRSNIVYDEAVVARSHKLIRHIGNIHSQLNTKGDVFDLDGTRTGQFAFTHGVGSVGNYGMFQPNAGPGPSENQSYAGINGTIGTSSTTPLVSYAAMWTNYRGTTGSGGTAVAGAGGGTYMLAGGSPARGVVPDPVLRFDLAGVARQAANDHAGAYAG